MTNTLHFKTIFRILVIAIAVFSLRISAEDGSCFIKDGDRVGFFGDSITAAKVYCQLVERVFRHSHPKAKVEFINNGQSGLKLSATKLERLLKGNPNVITIMIGMNDAINSKWIQGDPVEPKVEKYRTELTALVQGLKKKGKIVVLLSPTLTDETVMSAFRLEGTENLLRQMGKVCKEVARKEAVYFVPVQSEFEKYQEQLPRFAVLRYDGVHPCARGHYQIAQSLWKHLNLGAPLAGERKIVNSPKSPAVDVTLSSNLIFDPTKKLSLNLKTQQPGPVKVTWSSGKEQGSANLTLKGKDVWTLTLQTSSIPQKAGSSEAVVVELERNGARQFFILDLFCKTVLHGKDGKAEGKISDDKGKVLADYQFSKEGKDLRFDASVYKEKIFHSQGDIWPWGKGDAITLFLDLREESNLSGLGYDGNVFQVWFKPWEKPSYSPGFIPWAGKKMVNMATIFGERNAKGYSVGLLLSGRINIKEPVDFSNRKLIGFDMSLIYAQAIGKQKWLGVQKNDRQSFLFPGIFSLVDFYGTIKEDSALTLSIFPGNP